MVYDVKELKENGTLDILKNISMKDFKDTVNSCIWLGLELYKKYDINIIHKIILMNIREGLHKLYIQNGLDEEVMSNIIRVNTWTITMYVECNEISVWEEIGQYYFDKKSVSNANTTDDICTLLNNPSFEYRVNENIENIESLSMYDYLIKLIELKRRAMIGHYESEIASYKKNIRSVKKMISDLDKIDVERICGNVE